MSNNILIPQTSQPTKEADVFLGPLSHRAVTDMTSCIPSTSSQAQRERVAKDTLLFKLETLGAEGSRVTNTE